MRYAKAFAAALTAGLGSYAVAMADSHVTSQEWITVVAAVVTALGITWAVPNNPPPNPPV